MAYVYQKSATTGAVTDPTPTAGFTSTRYLQNSDGIFLVNKTEYKIPQEKSREYYRKIWSR